MSGFELDLNAIAAVMHGCGYEQARADGGLVLFVPRAGSGLYPNAVLVLDMARTRIRESGFRAQLVDQGMPNDLIEAELASVRGVG